MGRTSVLFSRPNLHRGSEACRLRWDEMRWDWSKHPNFLQMS
ncbi:hypothetical protein OIU84_029442 [Salix udensis]|uniref:Uncharacterized protein n=1 Tax=Salix udensis TaxID=889485 RepID=A0AAD6KBP3_9ROSI|nr:hypothetical protein OIU84_029442 [Salix udensis]